MPLLPKKRQRAFRVSLVVVTGALVLNSFVTPRAPLQVLRGNVLNDHSNVTVDNSTIHHSNVTVDDSLETVPGAKMSIVTSKPSTHTNIMTASMTHPVNDAGKVEDAANITAKEKMGIPAKKLNGGLNTSEATKDNGAARMQLAPNRTRIGAARIQALMNRTRLTKDNGAARIQLAPNRTRIGIHDRIRLKNAARATNKYNSSAGFIHLGKTGGSTLSLQLRNGCHSFVEKPCHKVPNETIVSELVTDYYHSK